MKKSMYWGILAVVTLACVIFGAFHYIKPYNHNSRKNNIQVSGDVLSSPFKISLEKFKNIEIDANIMELQVLQGQDFSVEGNFTRDELCPEISVSGETLHVFQQEIKTKQFAGSQKAELTVYVPVNSKIEDCSIKVNVGEVSVKDIYAESISIKNNIGEISVRNADFSVLDAKNNVGEISVSVGDSLSGYSIDAETNIGEVSVAGEKSRRSYKKDASGSRKITAKTNIGEVRIK